MYEYAQIDSVATVAESAMVVDTTTPNVVLDTVATCADSVVLCADSVFVGGVRVVEENILPTLSALDVQMLSPLVQAVMLGVVLLYLFVMYRRRTQVIEMASWIIYSSPQPILESHIDLRTMLPWRLFGLFSLGSVATILFYKIFELCVAIAPMVLVSAAVVAVALVWLLQSFLIWMIGAVALKQRFTEAVSAVRSFAVELSGVVLTPFVVAYAFGGESGSEALWWIILLITIIVVGIFAFKLLKLFIGARFSIFYWILYLCAVEFFPMSLAVVVMLRLL